MSLTLKLTSLFIRTAAKPIGNWIKSQAREHERFRKTCITFAQGLHRIDMRMRLGLLQDLAAIDRQVAREAAEAEAAKQQRSKSAAVPTVKTEEQTKAEESEREAERKGIEGRVKGKTEKKERAKIRPLSEAKAIDSGANFISETFLFLVAGGLIVFETARARRNENRRRGEVAERLARVEEELRAAEGERERLKEVVESLRLKEKDEVGRAAGEKIREEGKGVKVSG